VVDREPLVPFTYHAFIDRVVDGDTVDVEIDLGFDTWRNQRVRIAGINAPEKNTAKGKMAIAVVTDMLRVGDHVIMRTYKSGSRDKYGRWLADIHPVKDGVVKDSVGATLITAGLAVAWDGKGVRPEV
jgi:endonuclease YncB( thermonuclease family)